MSIYTRHGDRAQTTSFDGERIEKTSAKIAAYGDIDELAAHLGLLKAMIADSAEAAEEHAFLEHLQRHLFAVGWCLMSAHQADVCFATLTAELERRIDGIDQSLPPLHTFVIPGNNMAEAEAHVCRTVCRRAERAVCAVAKEHDTNPEILAFINRLSDYLFVLARKLNFIAHLEEKRWNKTCR